MSKLLNKLLILRMPGIGPVGYAKLIQRFGDDQSVVDFLGEKLNPIRETVLREMDSAQNLGVHYICDDEDFYPNNLKSLKNHPPILTARGNLETLKKPVVSMVGTRHATAAGMQFMAHLAQKFTEHGYAVASGMAIGTDTSAHKGALRTKGDTQTIAVLAGGVDKVWPLENESLYQKILERGVVISEMPIGMTPLGRHFALRNHWIAGICEKLILGEADMKSGSMITVKFAMNYQKEIYAIPSHPSDSRGQGPNFLIQKGIAKLCSGESDFFEENAKTKNKKIFSGKNKNENSVLDKIGLIPVPESVLSALAKKSVAEIKNELVMLELQGIIRKVDGGYVRL